LEEDVKGENRDGRAEEGHEKSMRWCLCLEEDEKGEMEMEELEDGMTGA